MACFLAATVKSKLGLLLAGFDHLEIKKQFKNFVWSDKF
jgi:hypothetical protein